MLFSFELDGSLYIFAKRKSRTSVLVTWDEPHNITSPERIFNTSYTGQILNETIANWTITRNTTSVELLGLTACVIYTINVNMLTSELHQRPPRYKEVIVVIRGKAKGQTEEGER